MLKCKCKIVCLKMPLEVSLDLIDLSSAGSVFHTAGPAKENEKCICVKNYKSCLAVDKVIEIIKKLFFVGPW